MFPHLHAEADRGLARTAPHPTQIARTSPASPSKRLATGSKYHPNAYTFKRSEHALYNELLLSIAHNRCRKHEPHTSSPQHRPKTEGHEASSHDIDSKKLMKLTDLFLQKHPASSSKCLISFPIICFLCILVL
jgi:hypothetical protein